MREICNKTAIAMNEVRICRENVRGKAFIPRRIDIEVLRANKKRFKGVIIKGVR